MKFTFKITDKIREVWPIYKAHFGTFLLLMVVTSVNQVIGSSKNWILISLSYVIGILLYYIWIRFSLSLVDKKDFNPFSRASLPSFSQFWNLFKTMILVVLCIILGFVLFVVPGFYVAGRLFLAMYLSIEKNQGGRISIKKSWNMTRGYGWILFWKSFVIGLFIALGFIALFIGSFITYPIGMVVMAIMYREFSKMKSQNPTLTKVINK